MERKRTRNDGFTEPQRQWILERDGRVCQLCQDNEKLEVHHISPWRYSAQVLHWTLERTNLPTNGITLCKVCHRGDENSIHPDIHRANGYYRDDRNIYNKVFAQRDALCRQNLPYWNVAHDSTMAIIAVQNTMKHIAAGNYPTPWDKGKEV